MRPIPFRLAMAAMLVPAAAAAAQETTRPAATQPTTMPAEVPATKDYLRSHFVKTEYQVPMRDGVMLHTAAYVPRDDSGRRYPILFLRTPYGIGPAGPENYPDPKGELKWFAHDGFIFVLQDVRGRGASDGKFVHVRPIGLTQTDERTDAWDSVDWMVRHLPNNNGNVGLVGSSYPGFYAACGAIDAHPAVKCAVPQAPVGDWFVGDDIHRNGALYLPSAYFFLRSMGDAKDKAKPDPTPDGYELFLKLGSPGFVKGLDGTYGFWDEVMAHPNYDAYWKARALPPQLTNVPVSTMTVGGWNDAEDLYGTLSTYQYTLKHNPANPHLLVMGPWGHGGWMSPTGELVGDIRFGTNLAGQFRRTMELPFLKQYLEPGAPQRQWPAVTSFDTGRREWQTFEQWPPKTPESRTLYLHGEGAISASAPAAGEPMADEFVSDPTHPVPYWNRVTKDTSGAYMSADQRFAAERPDVLVYQTRPLDQPMTVAGPVQVKLSVSTTGTDSDWVVKLIDVWPNDTRNPEPNPGGVVMGGYQQLIRLDVMPARFRQGLERPLATKPNEVTEIPLSMVDVHHTWLPRHRLMVQVQSSCFPMFAMNPQTFVENPCLAPREAYAKASHRLYHAPARASTIQLPMPDRE